jgi:hypothetical protein
MELTDKVLERAREKAKGTEHGSLEIIFDENKPFVDVVLHDRERVEIAIAAVPRKTYQDSPKAGRCS